MRLASRLGAALTAAACWAAPAEACTIGTTAVAFGQYDPRSATPDDGVGSVTLNCSAFRSASVSMSTGSGTYLQRKMTSGTNTLNYNLYTTSTRTIVWGNGTSGSSIVPLARNFTGTITVYGRIPAGQNVRAGTYTDTVTVTVTF